MSQQFEGVSVPTGTTWAALQRAIEDEFALDIFWVRVTEENTKVVVRGEVASEEAKRDICNLIKQFVPGKTVVNEILATSPLYPASQSHLDFDIVDEEYSLNSPIIRHPRISCDQNLFAGKLCVFEVDLTSEPDNETDGDPLQIGISDPNWESLLVSVEFSSFELEVEPEDARRNISLYRNGTSKKARFSAKVKDDVGSADLVNVKVIFSTNGRVRGFATRLFNVVASSGHAPPTQGASSKTTGDFVHDKSSPASLTIKISHNANSLGQCTWSFEAPEFKHLGEVSAMPRIELGTKANSYFQNKFAQVKTLDKGKHIGTLRGLGEHIWGVAPPEFQRLYLAMCAELGNSFSIQIFTDEPHVPWELMRPTSDGEHADHLCMTHPIGRWNMSRGLIPSIPKGGITSFVPDYDDGSLPAAIEEGQWLCSEFGAHAAEATFLGFTQFLNSPADAATAILHFAGHGAGEEAEPRQRGLRMSDGWVPIEEINTGVKLGKRDQSLVLLNACYAGNHTNVLGALDGWPSAFIKVGFGGVVAPLWAVQDETACAVMKKAVTRLYRDGESLGSALLDARKDYRNVSAAAFSYVLYGDVMATMTR